LFSFAIQQLPKHADLFVLAIPIGSYQEWHFSRKNISILFQLATPYPENAEEL